jgi:hypothetical protein
MALLKLNGRLHFLDCNSIKVEKVSNGRFTVTMDGEMTFTVVGGRESGGAQHEWFCHCPRLYGDAWLPTNSMVKAIKMGAQY